MALISRAALRENRKNYNVRYYTVVYDFSTWPSFWMYKGSRRAYLQRFFRGVRPGAAQRGGGSPLRIGLFLSRTLPYYQRLIKFYGMIKNNDNQNLKNITKYRCCMVSKHLIWAHFKAEILQKFYWTSATSLLNIKTMFYWTSAASLLNICG